MPVQIIASGLIAAAMLVSADETRGPNAADIEAMRAYANNNFHAISNERNDRLARLEREFAWAEPILDAGVAPRPAINVYAACNYFQFTDVIPITDPNSNFVTDPLILFGAAVTQYVSNLMQSVSDELEAREYGQREADMFRTMVFEIELVPSLNFTSARQPAPDQCASAEQVLRDYVRVND